MCLLERRCKKGRKGMQGDNIRIAFFLFLQEKKKRHRTLFHKHGYSFPYFLSRPRVEATVAASWMVLASVERILPSSIVSRPAMVHPPGVVTESLMAAGCAPVVSTIRAAPWRTINKRSDHVPNIKNISWEAARAYWSSITHRYHHPDNLPWAASSVATSRGNPIITPPSASASNMTLNCTSVNDLCNESLFHETS